jgi:hypothetical protein
MPHATCHMHQHQHQRIPAHGCSMEGAPGSLGFLAKMPGLDGGAPSAPTPNAAPSASGPSGNGQASLPVSRAAGPRAGAPAGPAEDGVELADLDGGDKKKKAFTPSAGLSSQGMETRGCIWAVIPPKSMRGDRAAALGAGGALACGVASHCPAHLAFLRLWPHLCKPLAHADVPGPVSGPSTAVHPLQRRRSCWPSTGATSWRRRLRPRGSSSSGRRA